jgi:WD40 repeat protein
VEACVLTPSSGLLLTAGGTMVKVWDLVAGGRLLATLSPHQKTVKSLCLSGTGKYLGTGSLDRQAHWIDSASFKTVYSTQYISDTRFTKPLVHVADLLLELFLPEHRMSGRVDRLRGRSN